MTDQPELKPCPFCGGGASVWTTDAYSCDSADHVIGCQGCDIYTPFANVFESNVPSTSDAAAWNTRPALTPQPPVTPMALEDAAKIIYERGMRYLRLDVPEWVDGGNSLAQDEARAIATAIAGGGHE